MNNKAVFMCLGLVIASAAAQANLLTNGNLDKTYQQEIVPGFFLPKPLDWVNEGFRTIAGPYEDEMSSEPWAGPAPTPVTTDGAAGDDWGVFFKAFSGSTANGAATGHLYQDVAASAGNTYTLTGWAGGEANFMATGAEFALEFLDGSGAIIGSSVTDLMPTLLTPNGESFNYKQYTVVGIAPVGTAMVRARASMLGGMNNPNGGGQAYVVDDFDLTVQAVPEPATMAVLGLGALALVRRRRAK